MGAGALVLAVLCALIWLAGRAIASGSPPSNTALPVVSGKAVDGQLLEATNGTWSGSTPITYTYQWQACNRQGKECENLPSATESSYRVASADVEGTVRMVVTATNSYGSASAASVVTAEVASGPPVAVEAPVISGGAWEGETLSASGEGWAGSNVTAGYQWRRCNSSGAECSDIAGATEREYTLSSSDVGHTLRVRVGAGGSVGSLVALSAPSLAVAAKSSLRNTWLPGLSGTGKVGQTLTANPGSWVGAASLSYTYQWQRCNREGGGCANISGATSSTHVLVTADAGKTVRVLVKASEEGANAATVASTGELIAGEKGPVLEVAPGVSGTGLPEYTLTATTGKWAGTEIKYTYKWQKCNEAGEACAAISGATSQTYKLPTSVVGSTVRVLVIATLSGTSTEALSSPITVSATAVGDVSLPMVSGKPQVAHQLAATTGIWTDAVGITYTYQWERCNSKDESCAAIAGATEPTYTMVAADVGDTDRVTVTATGSSGKASASSAATGVVAAGSGAPENSVAPSIEGSTSSGSTLTAQPGLWFGEEPLSYSYQWEECNASGESCAGISGATSQTYVLGSGEVGSTVRVSVTAKNSQGSAGATSPVSEVIESAAAPSVSERPAVKGTAQEGNELFAENGTWTGSQPLRYFYRWERCNTAGEACSVISGATKPGYKATSSDVGSTLRVSVTVTNSLGGASSLSPQTSVVAGKEASAKEAMEVAEKTDPSVIASSASATLEGLSIKPNAADAGEGLAATSTLTSSWLSKETSGEFAVNTPIGEISLKPISTAANATITPLIVNGASAVYADTQAATDTIVRPQPLGAITMLQMRSSEAPTSFSWQVGLGANQKLQVLPNGSVAVTESGAGSGLEGEVEESEEKPSNETPAETKGEEGYSAEAAAEALQEATPEESKLSKLPNSQTSSTGEIKPKSGELQPQETKAQYEAAVTATSYAESHTENTTLMVLPAPTVVDAEGHTVPATLSVEGNTIKLSVTPGSAKYPVTAAVSVDAPTNTASAKRTPAPTYGLSSQSTTPFHEAEEEVEGKWQKVEHMDKNLTEGKNVKIKYARLVLPYNNLPKGKGLETWLKKVGETELPGGAHLVPEITFGKCTLVIEGEKGKPSEACLKQEKQRNFSEIYYHHVLSIMKALIKGNTKEHIPPVRIWGAWNEPELSSLKAGKAAEVWGAAVRAMHKAGCHVRCKMIAGEFAGYRKFPGHNELSYVTGYEKAIVEDARKKKWDAGKPEIWGLHDYKDLKETAETATLAGGKLVRESGAGSAEAQAFVQGTHKAGLGHPQDWISENGVQLWVRSGHTSLYRNPEGQRIAAEDFLELGKQSTGHIETNNYYEYKTPVTSAEEEEKEAEHDNSDQFDSALLSAEGKMPEAERPAYCVIALAYKGVCPPSTKTEAPVTGSISSTGGTVTLTVIPAGAVTKYRIEYGTTSSYGHATTVATTANAIGEQSETVLIGGLEPCTTYHYQAEAENEANKEKPSLGGDRTFTTSCKATAVSAGEEDTCAVLTNGHVDCWGGNYSGQLGIGNDTGPETAPCEESIPCSRYPVGVLNITNATGVSVGFQAACAVLSEGHVDCWGAGPVMPGGHQSFEPVQISEISNATAVSVGEDHACALLAEGGIDCWGDNEWGQLGNGKEGERENPAKVSELNNAVGISAGDTSSCAVLSTGKVDCWGRVPYYFSEFRQTVPREISAIANAMTVSVTGTGNLSACVLLANKSLGCWGDNFWGELGNGTTAGEGEERKSALTEVVEIANASAVSSGTTHACAVRETGTVYCWGSAEYGQLGNGVTTQTAYPTPGLVEGITSAKNVSAGNALTCALLASGGIDCWGYNGDGRLGNGTTKLSSTPVQVSGIG